MEHIYSAAGIIGILFLLFSGFIPKIYTKYYYHFVDEYIVPLSLYFLGIFFISYFFTGVWLIVSLQSYIGLALISILTIAYGYTVQKKIDKTSIVRTIIIKFSRQVYILYIAITLLSVLLFYFVSVSTGAILIYGQIFYFLLMFVFLYYGKLYEDKRREKLQQGMYELETTTLGDIVAYFSKEINKDYSLLLQDIEYILGACVELIYENYVPEELYTIDGDKITALIEKYILTENTVSKQEKLLIKEVIAHREKLILWKKNFDKKILDESGNVKITPVKKEEFPDKKQNILSKPPSSVG